MVLIFKAGILTGSTMWPRSQGWSGWLARSSASGWLWHEATRQQAGHSCTYAQTCLWPLPWWCFCCGAEADWGCLDWLGGCEKSGAHWNTRCGLAATFPVMPKWPCLHLAQRIVGWAMPTSRALLYVLSFCSWWIFQYYFELSKYCRCKSALRVLIWFRVVIVIWVQYA